MSSPVRFLEDVAEFMTLARNGLVGLQTGAVFLFPLVLSVWLWASHLRVPGVCSAEVEVVEDVRMPKT